MHLTVISYRQGLDRMFEAVALAAHPGPQHAFAFCQRAGYLLDCVLNAGLNVTLLDLVGHGSSVHMCLGDDILLRSGHQPDPVLGRLNRLLPAQAKVRLLGCGTGVGESGLAMLRAASQALGGREVLGTTAPIFPWDFGPDGLQERLASRFLVSSRVAEPVPGLDRFGATEEPSPTASTPPALRPVTG